MPCDQRCALGFGVGPRHAVRIQALDVSGRKFKDKGNSDLNAYANVLSLLGLRVIRKAGPLKLINALEIQHCTDESQFTARYVVPKVQFLKAVEQFALGHAKERWPAGS